MRKIFTILLVLVIGLSNDIYAQSKQNKELATVMGFIKEDSQDHIFTSFSNVRLIAGKDTLKKVATQNKFVFEDIVPGKIKIAVSNVAFESQENTYEVVAGSNMIYITLKEKKTELKEAVVSAKTQIMREIKDTIIYNAAAVNTMEGDNAIEIFKQLPGTSIENGKFLVFGEEIKRTYVNGVLIYGENPDEAMNALLAKEVVNMKVYDEDNVADVRDGIKNARKERVLDIITYSDIMSAIDAYMIAGYGIDVEQDIHGINRSRYNGGLTAGYYSEMLKLKVEGLANNIGRETNELNGMMSVGSPMDSYKEKSYVKFEGEKYWKDRRLGNSLLVRYRYDKDYSLSESYSSTRYFPTEETPQMHYLDSSTFADVRHHHTLSLYSDLQSTPLKQILLYADGDISKSSQDRHDYVRNDVENTIYRQNETDRSNDDNKSIMAGIRWGDHDGWGKMMPSIRLQGKFSDNRCVAMQADTTESSLTRRVLESEAVGKSTSLSGIFNLNTIMINRENLTFTWRNEYLYCYDRHKNMKSTYDLFDLSEPVLNLANTHDFTYNVQTHNLSTAIEMNTSNKMFAQISFGMGVDIQSDFEAFPETYSFSKKFWFIKPRLYIEYKGLNMSYQIENEIPSIEQLRNRIDDSNPLMLIAGNPDLKQAKTGDFSLTWSHRAGKTGLLSTGLKLQHSWDAIVPRMTYFSENTRLDAFDYNVLAGSSLYSFDNVGGRISCSSYLNYKQRMYKIKGNFHVVSEYAYGRQPQYVGDILEVMNQHRLTLGLSLASAPVKWIRAMVSADFGYMTSNNSLKQSLLGQFSQSYKAIATIKLLKNAFVDASYRLHCYNYLTSTGTDQAFHHLNAVLGYKFMESRLTISISATDILSATSNYKVTSTSNSVKESWVPYTGRYVMFNIYYRFNKTSPNKY